MKKLTKKQRQFIEVFVANINKELEKMYKDAIIYGSGFCKFDAHGNFRHATYDEVYKASKSIKKNAIKK